MGDWPKTQKEAINYLRKSKKKLDKVIDYHIRKEAIFAVHPKIASLLTAKAIETSSMDPILLTDVEIEGHPVYVVPEANPDQQGWYGAKGNIIKELRGPTHVRS